jgi:hypothetical protein
MPQEDADASQVYEAEKVLGVQLFERLLDDELRVGRSQPSTMTTVIPRAYGQG